LQGGSLRSPPAIVGPLPSKTWATSPAIRPARRWLAGDGLAARLAGIAIAVGDEALDRLFAFSRPSR
jgi:hypothetical protein